MVALCVCLKKNNKAEEPKEEVVEVVDGAVVEKKADEVEAKDGEEGAETTEVKVEVEGAEKKEDDDEEGEKKEDEEKKEEEAVEESPKAEEKDDEAALEE